MLAPDRLVTGVTTGLAFLPVAGESRWLTPVGLRHRRTAAAVLPAAAVRPAAHARLATLAEPGAPGRPVGRAAAVRRSRRRHPDLCLGRAGDGGHLDVGADPVADRRGRVHRVRAAPALRPTSPAPPRRVRPAPGVGRADRVLPDRCQPDRRAGRHPVLRPPDDLSRLAGRCGHGSGALPHRPSRRRADRWAAAAVHSADVADGRRHGGQHGRLRPHGDVGPERAAARERTHGARRPAASGSVWRSRRSTPPSSITPTARSTASPAEC